MKLKQISVKNLFGVFNHTIPLKEERITIIHGPNGYGKTVLLRMVDGLFKQNYGIFRRIPFEEFRVDFEDGNFVSVKQLIGKGHSEKGKISILWSDPSEKAYFPEITMERHIPLGMIEDVIFELTRVGRSEWLDGRTGQILTLEEVIERYGENFPFPVQYPQPPKWLKNLQKNVQTHFVQTNRLLSQTTTLRRPPRTAYERSVVFESQAITVSETAVTQYSQQLAGKIQQTLAKSAELSQSLDRTFPIRLVNQIGKSKKPKITTNRLRDKLKELENKRERLMAAGLMDKADADVQIPEQTAMEDLARIALSIYASDVEKKLKVFDELLEKIGLLQEIINARYAYSYKQLVIDKNRGFVFQTRDGTPLSADALSSGEQHELVLFYELLFRVQPGSFILIDEPELSLHIAWQQVFLKDLKAISDLANIDVLIATHSADIIYDKWNLTVELKGPEENG